MKPYDFFSPRRLVFGPGRIRLLPGLAAAFGKKLILVTGKTSFLDSPEWDTLEKGFAEQKINVNHVTVSGEPSPDDIDPVVRRYSDRGIELVVAVGGGSALDAGKSISAMMGQDCPVTDYLDDIGKGPHPGSKLPFIAVPTTSGTGSEATKNAVVSRPGPKGFKKSLRHDNFIPDIALVDPALTLACPPEITAACGLDALTQLIEAYVSVNASPMTDALCISGLNGFGNALETAVKKNPKDLDARTRLSYGAYLSGLALANAGLGTVHGFASVIGGLCRMSHGNVCGTLLAETTRATMDILRENEKGRPALEKYANTARLLGLAPSSQNHDDACRSLVEGLYRWTEIFKIPGLSAAGITEENLMGIAGAAGQKNNPAPLPRETCRRVLEARL
ncbi:MAG: iron-containing alcohol dehydrogenase [Desulfobacter sp.]|nr:MAG: iron-containing alcohol dehydrogenase [Desulfobacter sp.]